MPSMGKIKFPHIEQPALRVRVQRYFMAIFCFLYLIIGFGIIACGAILISQRQMECSFMAQYYSGVCIILAAGCFTSFFSICGCLQTRQNNAPHYYQSYVLVLVIVVVSEIAGAVASHILISLASEGQLISELTSAREEYWTSGSKAGCIDQIQGQFKCCGVSDYTEWSTSYDSSTNHSVFPQSCVCGAEESNFCVKASPGTQHNNTGISKGSASVALLVFRNSCYKPLLEDLSENLLISRIVGPAIAVVQLVLLSMVIFFLHQVNNRSLVGAYVVRQPTIIPTTNFSEPLSSPGTNDARWVEMRENQAPVASDGVSRSCRKKRKGLPEDPKSNSLSREETVRPDTDRDETVLSG